MYYEKAKQFIDDFLVKNQLSELSETVHKNLHYCLDYDIFHIEDETEEPLGISKLYGLPHLPGSIDFPPDMLFLGQFNCAEIKPFDIFNRFPEKGILYFFVDDTGTETECFFYDGPVEDLKICPYPDPEDPESFLEDQEEYIESAYTISFDDTELCILSRGWEESFGDMSLIFIEELKQAFGDKILIIGHDEYYEFPDDFIFGAPRFWQDEEKDENLEMLLCFKFTEEGNINYFVEDGTLDPNKDVYEQIEGIYSGT